MATTALRRYGSQLKKMWEIAGPAMITEISQFSIALVTSAFVGHIGPLQLAAASIVLNVLEEFALGFMLGIGSASETLSGQAVGAEKLYMLGIYMQRSWLLSIATALLLTPIYVLASPIFHTLLGQEKQISELAGRFAVWMVPQLFFFALNFPMQKFLQAQSRVWVLAGISSAVLSVHVLLNWVFVSKLGYGIIGAAVVGDVSWFLLVAAQVVYMVWSSFDSWTGFSTKAFSSFPAFAKLSLASAVLSCLEIWYPTMVILMVGWLENPEIAVAASSICLNFQYWAWIIAAGFNAAVSVRVSNELGAGNHEAAKLSIAVTICTSTVVGVTFSTVVLASKNEFPKLFSSDSDVIREAGNLAYFSAAVIFLDIIMPVLHGVAVGAGWQSQVAVVNIVCYYVVGLPLAAMLGYTFEFGVKGIWSGMVVGCVLQMAFLLFVIHTTNWETEASKSEARMKDWGEISETQPIVGDTEENELEESSFEGRQS
ncbi:unnamed protein product [Linum trigynum]|uniref:Protein DETOXIFICATION n=1 Tax=Linum trigynum TaxID=586398 RepID=A0AAV2D5X5_9ROSI